MPPWAVTYFAHAWRVGVVCATEEASGPVQLQTSPMTIGAFVAAPADCPIVSRPAVTVTAPRRQAACRFNLIGAPLCRRAAETWPHIRSSHCPRRRAWYSRQICFQRRVMTAHHSKFPVADRGRPGLSFIRYGGLVGLEP